MEQSHACECHCHAVFVACSDNIVITDGAAGFCNVGNAALRCSFDVVTEGEERVRAQSNACHCSQVCFLFFSCQRFGFFGEQCLPCAFCQYIFVIVGDINVDCVISVRTTYCRQERQVQNFLVLSQVPDICFVASQSCAVDSGLLTSANTDCLTVFCEAYRVGLCIFQSDQCDDQVAFCFFRQFFVFCYDIFQQSFVDFEVVSALFECDTEYLFYFLYFRNVVGVDLYDIVVAVSFGFQDFLK